MKKLVVYGDIHGCYNELIALREKINPKDSDIEICVGDIITKGKESIKTLRYIRKNNIQSVLGNYEDKIVRYLTYKKSLKKNPITLNLDEQNIVNNLNSTDIDFISDMPVFKRFNNITVIHGGLSNKDNLENNISKKTKSRILRTRYLDKNYNFLSYGKENNQSVFWADVYDGRQGFVVYGHQKFKEVNINKYALGIDTGCVDGSKLSAVIFVEKLNKFIFQKSVLLDSIVVNK